MSQRILSFSYEFLASIAKEGTRAYRVIENALPKEARIVRVIENWQHMGECGVVVESNEWAPLPFGEPIPILATPAIRHVEAPHDGSTLADVARALKDCFPDRADVLIAEVIRWKETEEAQFTEFQDAVNREVTRRERVRKQIEAHRR